MNLSELFDVEYERLAAYLSRHSDPETGEDLASEAFAKLAANPAADPAPALWRNALGLLSDWRRNRSTRPDTLTGIPVGSERRQGGEARNFSIEAAMFRADFDRAFRALPPPCAEAFALTELRGLTTREAEQITGVSRPTLSRRAALARSILKEELA